MTPTKRKLDTPGRIRAGAPQGDADMFARRRAQDLRQAETTAWNPPSRGVRRYA